MGEGSTFLFFLLIQVAIIYASTSVGRSKGRGFQGFLLGFFLSLLGLIIIAVLPETREVAASKTKELADLLGGAPSQGKNGTRSRESFRQEAMKTALAQDASLLNDDPDSLEALRHRTEAIMDQLYLVHCRESAKQEIAREEELRASEVQAQAEMQAHAEHERELRETRERELLDRQAKERERIDGYSRRWKPLGFFYANRKVLLVSVSVLAVLAAMIVPRSIQERREAELKAQYEQNQAEARAAFNAKQEALKPYKQCNSAVEDISDALYVWAMSPSEAVFKDPAEMGKVFPAFKSKSAGLFGKITAVDRSDEMARNLESITRLAQAYFETATSLASKMSNSSYSKRMESAWQPFRDFLADPDSDTNDMEAEAAKARKAEAAIEKLALSWIKQDGQYQDAERLFTNLQDQLATISRDCGKLTSQTK